MEDLLKKKIVNSEEVAVKIAKKEKMESMHQQYHQLSINIRKLRQLHGETQDELAAAIGVSGAMISYYENEKRIPTRDELYLISKRYGVTISQLYGDCSNIHYHPNVLINDRENKEIILCNLLPIIQSDHALENTNFKEALDLHLKIYEFICNDDLQSAELLNDRCTRLYKKAVEEGVTEASANLIWWPMYRLVGFYVFNRKLKESKLKKKGDATLSDLFDEGLLPTLNDVEVDEEFEETRSAVIDSYLPDIMKNIYCLKNSSDIGLQDLGDYYIALGYYYDITNDRLSKEENRMVGKEMLRMCWLLKNRYAEDYYSMFINPDNYVDIQ